MTAAQFDPRALHDRLEAAYYALARTCPRWLEVATPYGIIGGFAGLDAPTMNRVARVDAPSDEALQTLLDQARDHFDTRQVAFTVAVTPHARPAHTDRFLRRHGYHNAARLEIMVRGALAERPRVRSSAVVKEVVRDDAAWYTSHVVDAFDLPPRYLPALTDITLAWMDAGGVPFVAEQDGHVVGTAMLARFDGIATVYNVAAYARHRGRGIGTALMARLFDVYEAGPDDVLTLQVAAGTPAVRFYENLGFKTQYAWDLFMRVV